jgi:hypothetical protein
MYIYDKFNSSWNEKCFRQICRENQTTQFIFCQLFHKIVPVVRCVEKQGRAGQATDDNILRCIRIACWANKARNTIAEYVIFVFSREQCLSERATKLRIFAVVFSFFATINTSVRGRVNCPYTCRKFSRFHYFWP